MMRKQPGATSASVSTLQNTVRRTEGHAVCSASIMGALAPDPGTGVRGIYTWVDRDGRVRIVPLP